MNESNAEKLYESLEMELSAVEEKGGSRMEVLNSCVQVASTYLIRLQSIITDEQFEKAAEARFFKETKPKFWAKQLYYLGVLRFEAAEPASMPAKIRHCEKAVAGIEQMWAEHEDFYLYWKSEQTHFDQVYFTRRSQTSLFTLPDICQAIDLRYSTGYDFLVGKFLANQHFALYLQGIAAALTSAETSDCKGAQKTGFVQTPLKAPQVYVFLRALIDAEIIMNHTYTSLFELLVPHITNKQLKAYSAGNLLKYSDKVDIDTKDTVKRFLQKMTRNVDSY